jgi:uncharacterized alpha-E superfamily protein
LLDVKFHARNTEFFGSGLGNETKEVDFYHWSAVLRSVSAFEVYRKVYRNVIRPEKVAELLILRPDMPRSLVACMNEVVSNLQAVANDHSDETLRRAGRLRADLQYGRIDEIVATGLHAYLTQFLDRVGDLGYGISRDMTEETSSPATDVAAALPPGWLQIDSLDMDAQGSPGVLTAKWCLSRGP